MMLCHCREQVGGTRTHHTAGDSTVLRGVSRGLGTMLGRQLPCSA